MKYSIVTFGCRVNQADSLALESALSTRGATASSADQADIVIVNTCSVTGAADQGARQLIRKIHRRNTRARIVVTGCYATRAEEEVSPLPGVARLFSNDDKENLVAQLLSDFDPARANQDAGDGRGVGTGPDVRERVSEHTDAGDGRRTAVEPDVRERVSTSRDVAERAGIGVGPGMMGRTAYSLRVQTGCDERCAFCVVPSTRGPSRSRSVAALSADVDRLGRAGFKEVWLVGVHLGSFGRDLEPAATLVDLLSSLDRTPGDVSFRLGSIEPMDCPAALVDLIARSGRFAAHFHLPLQHASDSMLAAMRRPYRFALYRELVDRIRTRLPHAAIGADLIVGFPGETAQEFETSAQAIAALPLSYLHVFPYSDRPGTESSRLTPKVRDIDIHTRAETLRAIGRDLHARFLRRQIGSVRSGLTLDDGTIVLTDNYLKVRIAAGHARNERLLVRIDRTEPHVTGTVVDQMPGGATPAWPPTRSP